jgi:long-chain acyl-CoA synthetase
MDWSTYPIPPMRHEARFGDRVVLAFAARPKSIWAMVESAVARNPDGEALVCGDVRMTWREVHERSARIAAGLEALGLKSADRIAVLLGNRIEFALALFAAANLGLVTVLLSTRQQKPEIAYVLTDCGAKLLIHEAALADRLPDAGDVPDLTIFDPCGSRAAIRAGRRRRGGYRDDPLHVRHHRAAQGSDAGALQHRPFGDDV